MMLSLLLATLLTPWGENGSYKSGHAEYPRPQLVRTNWTNLNGEWDYALETNTVAGLPVVRAQGKIRVPFCFESALSGVGIKVTPEDRMIYRRTVELHPKKGRRTLLNFEAVDYSTQVFVNGVEATDAPHEGGSLPFTVDITPFVREGANALEVKVWDPTEGQASTAVAASRRSSRAAATIRAFPASGRPCGWRRCRRGTSGGIRS